MRKRKQYSGSINANAIIRIMELIHGDGWDRNKSSNQLWLANSEESWSVEDFDVFIEKYSTGLYSSYTIETENSARERIGIELISGETNISIFSNSALVIENHFNKIDNIFTENIIMKPEASSKTVKQYYFREEKFHWALIQKAIDCFKHICENRYIKVTLAKITFENESFSVDDLELFAEKYDLNKIKTYYITLRDPISLKEFSLSLYSDTTTIELKSEADVDFARIANIFKNCSESEKCQIMRKGSTKPKIFIGHGRNSQWEKLKSHLQDKHAVDVIAYETGNRAGHTIRDILENMSSEASMALLVLTGEDKTVEGLRARQNVVHECGLFQGKLGFDRAILLVENGVELASNFDGIQQLRFKKSRISETFGDVIATLRREFGPI